MHGGTIKKECHHPVLEFQSTVLHGNLLKLYPMDHFIDVNDVFQYVRLVAGPQGHF